MVACGGTIAGMGFLLAAALSFGLAEGSQNGFTPETLQGLSGLSNEAQVIFSGGIGIMLFGAAALLMGRPGLLKILGWVALIIAIAIFAPLSVGLIAFALSGLWILVVSIMLAARGTAQAASA